MQPTTQMRTPAIHVEQCGSPALPSRRSRGPLIPVVERYVLPPAPTGLHRTDNVIPARAVPSWDQ